MHPAARPLDPRAQPVPLGFRTDSAGTRVLSFPRLTIAVDGDTLDMLFDTGAMVYLSAEAQHHLGNAARAVQATSLITSEVFNRWRARHPDWALIPNADERVPGMAMIRVPEVIVAGLAVGPVWFLERPDANFHEYMSQWMDRQVDGALGGNVFRFFKITLDYPAAIAHFVKSKSSG